MTRPIPGAKRGGARIPGPGKRLGPRPVAMSTRSAKRGPIRLTPAEAGQLDERAAERGLSVYEAIRTALRVDGLID